MQDSPTTRKGNMFRLFPLTFLVALGLKRDPNLPNQRANDGAPLEIFIRRYWLVIATLFTIAVWVRSDHSLNAQDHETMKRDIQRNEDIIKDFCKNYGPKIDSMYVWRVREEERQKARQDARNNH